MKVILLKDIPGTGRKNDVKEIAPGYASNFLFPQRLAVVATESALKTLEKTKVRSATEQKIQAELLAKNLESLNGAEIILKERANDEGHLFAGIHKDEILAEIKKQLKKEIPEAALILDTPIKTIGSTKVPIVVGEEKAMLTVSVERGEK